MSLREVIIQFNSRFDPRGMLALMSSMNKAEGEANKFEVTLQRISTAFIGIGSAAMLAFKQYEMSLTEFAGKAMNTVDEFARKFARVSGQISRDTGLIRHEVFRGLQEGTSALLGPTQAAKVTKKSAILAAGRQARMPQAMSVSLSGYRNKFGTPAQVLDYVYSSAQLGQGQVAEFAPAWQYVLGFARGAGLELKEVAAGIAAISATAPSPLMGSTQFGAFLTGIARGSTYEQKLIQGSGKTSQDLRDMLREEGLAKTTEFLASKFTGDELQQVFGRKEFVQFVQGTTGRRGILAKLEKLIVENAETKPIERFGEDLERTLGNKFDRFIQSFIQLGSEFGEPLAFAAKRLLDVSNIFLSAIISLNQMTGGLLAVVLSAAGAFTVVSALLGKEVRGFIKGAFVRLFGFGKDAMGKQQAVNAAAAAAFASAPAGSGFTAAQAAAAEAAAAYASAKAATASPADYMNAQNAREKARDAADRAAASRRGKPSDYVNAQNAREQARQAADAAAEATAKASAKAHASSSGPQQGFDTGAKAWNDARKARQESMFRAFAREGEDFERRSRAYEWKREQEAKREDIRRRRAAWREKHGAEFERRFANDFDPRSRPERMWEKVRRHKAHVDAVRKAHEDQVLRMSALVDDLIRQGKVDPRHRRGVLESLMRVRQPLNDFQVPPIDPFFYKGADDLFKRTGYRPVTDQDELISKHKRTKKGMDVDEFLYKKWRGHGATLGEVTPDMVQKSKRAMFEVVSAMPYMDPGSYYQKYRQPVSSYLETIMNVASMHPPGRGGARRSGPALLGYNAPFKPTPGRKIPPGYGMDNGMGPKAAGNYWDILMTIPFLMGQGWDALRGGDYRKVFGGGGFGTGFNAAMGGTGLFDMLGTVRDYNANAEAKGRKGMRENMAKVAWFMGKFWRIATNPLMLGTAIAAAVYAGGLAWFNRTERGREHLSLLEYRKESLFNEEKILQLQVDQGKAILAAIQADLNARGPAGGTGKYSSFLEMFQDGWQFMKDGIENWRNIHQKNRTAHKLLAMYSGGKLTPEQQYNMFKWFAQAGLEDFEAIPRRKPGKHGEKYFFKLKWAPDHDTKMRLLVGDMKTETFLNQGSPGGITGGGLIDWALTEGNDYFERLAKDGPKGARDYAYQARGMAHRAGIGVEGRAVTYIPIKSVINLYADPGQDLADLVDEGLAKQMVYFARRITRESAVEVNPHGALPYEYGHVP